VFYFSYVQIVEHGRQLSSSEFVINVFRLVLKTWYCAVEELKIYILTWDHLPVIDTLYANTLSR